MTGTSADAVDAALVAVDSSGAAVRPELVAYRETPLEPALRHEVLEVAAAGSLPLERLMRLDAALGECYAAAVFDLLAAAGMAPDGLDAIGLHGQTVRHVPRPERGGQALTLQIGSASILAERTGVTVVSDFRSRDTAAGGEGAPLVPMVDWWLFRSEHESRVLLNLGGMANLTWLPRGGGLEQVLAFDTGPGNAVSDHLAGLLSGGRETRDEAGRRAARGTPSPALLERLLADPWFALEPPRSTGRERFGRDFAETLLAQSRAAGLSGEDALATAVELTAASVAGAVTRHVEPRGRVDAVVVSGGGIANAALMEALGRRLAPAPLVPLETLGFPAAAKEALAFALLAHLTLSGEPGNVPAATGAARPVVLGRISPGRWP
jgi:anhydro-N-acetylmuramic acid kinase